MRANQKTRRRVFPQWHRPIVRDFGIHISHKNNTWPNFFKILSEHFASHQTFPVVYPGVKIRSKQTIGSNRRSHRARTLAKANKRDPIRYILVPLHDSEIHAVVGGLSKLKKDKSIPEREWRKLVGDLVAALFVEKVVKPKARK
jgi:hypothetical protein